MEAVMGSSSSPPYLKLVSCRDNNKRFLSLKDHFFAKSLFKLPLYHSCNKNLHDFNLAISVSSTREALLPVSLSSSQTQAEVENHELQIEQSSNGYLIKAEEDTEGETHGQTVRVRFQLQRECSFGQNFLIVGDDPKIGLWDPNNAVPLTWSDGHVWTVDLDIPIRKCIRFKFIMQESNGKFVWQPGPDRILECCETKKIITLCEDWENPDSRRIIEAHPIELETVAANEGMPVEPSSMEVRTEEPKGYAVNMKEVLVSDEVVPVLVPGLSHLGSVDTEQEGSKDEPELVNGAAMVSTGADMANDLKLPELNLKVDANISNTNHDSCENQRQETQELVEEQDHEATQPMENLLINDVRFGKNVLQKLLSIFGIQ